MARPRPPLWLTRPSRFATLTRGQARIGLGVLALLLLASLSVLGVAPPPPASVGPSGDRQTDLALYESIVAGVRHGGDYYPTAADALRAGGYPLRPFVTIRMPALAVVQAALPAMAVTAMQFLLAAAVGLAWYRRLRPAFARLLPLGVAMLLLAGGMLAFVQPGLGAFHEIWAGMLVALSLALRSPGRWVEAVAVGLIAMLVRETAALYVLIMALLAWLEGERREALGWGAAVGLFALALGAHAWGVAGVTGPLDPASPGWAGMNGFGLAVRAITLATALQLLPAIVAALLVALALFGWTAWNEGLALRMATVLACYAALIGVFARLDTFYWGLMIAPAFLVGLAFVPDGLRDLWAAALDRPRLRVQRIVQ